MLDSFANAANIVKEIPLQKAEGLTSEETSDIEEVKEWNRHLRQMQALKDDHELSGYDGKVLYFEAEDLSLQTKTINFDVQELAQKKQENLNSWRALAPHMNIYPVEADHMTMLDERFCNDYIEKINDIVLLHNS